MSFVDRFVNRRSIFTLFLIFSLSLISSFLIRLFFPDGVNTFEEKVQPSSVSTYQPRSQYVSSLRIVVEDPLLDIYQDVATVSAHTEMGHIIQREKLFSEYGTDRFLSDVGLPQDEQLQEFSYQVPSTSRIVHTSFHYYISLRQILSDSSLFFDFLCEKAILEVQTSWYLYILASLAATGIYILIHHISPIKVAFLTALLVFATFLSLGDTPGGILSVLFCICIFTGWLWIRANYSINLSPRKNEYSTSRFLPFLFSLIFFIFAVQHLGQFMSVDEPKWLYTRVPQLIESVRTFSPALSFINDKPGIFPSALAAIPAFFLPREWLSTNLEQYLFFWRLPVVVANSVFIYLAVRKMFQLFSFQTALLGSCFLSLHPILIGISQIVNPDATLWSTAFLSILFMFEYLKYSNHRAIVISGIWLGLALLSKYFAVPILIAYALLFLYRSIRKGTQILLKQSLFDWFLLSSIALITYSLFFPYVWVNPLYALTGTIGSSLYILSFTLLLYIFACSLLLFTFLHKLIARISPFTHRVASVVVLVFFSFLSLITLSGYTFFNPSSFLFEDFVNWKGTFLPSFTTSAFITFLTQPSPVLICCFILLLILIFSKRGRHLWDQHQDLYILTVLVATLLLFGAGITGNISIARYQIILYPLIALSSATLVDRISWKHFSPLLLSLLLFMVYSALASRPFYYHYNNEWNYQGIILTESWGYGGYELAQEAKNDENINNVWVDREGFMEFFPRRAFWRNSSYQDAEYIVTSHVGKTRIVPVKFSDLKASYARAEIISEFCFGYPIKSNCRTLIKR